MAGLLGQVFSAGNVARRKLTDLLGNPVLSAQQIVGNLNDRARVLNEMTAAAAKEGVDYGPASRQLASLLAEAYNPVGMISKVAPKSIDEIAKKYPNVIIDANVNKNDINLSRIVVPKEMRNQGIGTQVMTDLSNFADSIGKRITLTPSGDFGGNVPKLKTFYKELGFVENKGKNKDFSTREAMYREPQAVQQSTQFEYPQEEALRLAQQRAALPKEQYGLGLPPDNTPEMRAAAMQFERRGFHETEGKNIEQGLRSFDVKRVGAAASDEQTPYAMFIKPHGVNIGVARENPAQMPLYVKSNLTDENILNAFQNRDDLQNYLNQFPEIKKATQAVRDLDNQMADYMNQIMKKADDLYKQGKVEESDNLMDQISFGSPLMKQFDDRTNELAAIAKEKITEHFKEKGIGSIGLTDDTGAFGRRTITEMVLNPNENVRSAFAAFDPWRRTAAIAAATGTLAPDLMAQEIDYTLLPPKEKKKALELFSGLLGQ